jgi:hypothetical protein
MRWLSCKVVVVLINQRRGVVQMAEKAVDPIAERLFVDITPPKGDRHLSTHSFTFYSPLLGASSIHPISGMLSTTRSTAAMALRGTFESSLPLLLPAL